MLGRLFTLLSALSLLLCVAVVVLWVRSRSTFDNLCRADDLPGVAEPPARHRQVIRPYPLRLVSALPRSFGPPLLA